MRVESGMVAEILGNEEIRQRAGALMPGLRYKRVLALLHELLAPRTYLEIGVAGGGSLAIARPGSIAIGVDPEPLDGAGGRIYRQTSDDFFASNDVRAIFGGASVDLALIDGMHFFEYALRDFVNIERLSSPRSTILLHDCYPTCRVMAERDRRTGPWTGDVWKIVPVLRKYRPDLHIAVIAAAPSGLCVVRRLDPGSRVLGERLEVLAEEAARLDYSMLEADAARVLNLVPSNPESIKALLA